MAGQVFHHISDVVRRTIIGNEQENPFAELESSKVRILIIPNKTRKNLKNFDLLVTDNDQNKYAINRTLADLGWLRSNLRIDFPFSYVSFLINFDL